MKNLENIIEGINKTEYSEWHDVECTKEFKIDRKSWSMVFKIGEKYKASKINDNWWIIDQVGISSEDFKKHFKDI